MSEAVIVLSPGRANPDGSFADYGDDGSYIGGQVRMDAALQLVRERPGEHFYLVGGCEPESKLAPFSEKALAMGHFIYTALEYEDPESWRRVHPVASLPCTYHNFTAALRLLPASKLMAPGEITVDVLTNAYHIPRSQRFAEQAMGTCLRQNPAVKAKVILQWHAAENVVGKPLPESIEGDTTAMAAYAKRLAMEEQGIHDIKLGRYTDSCLRKYREAFTHMLAYHGTDLIPEQEYEKWGIYDHVRA